MPGPASRTQVTAKSKGAASAPKPPAPKKRKRADDPSASARAMYSPAPPTAREKTKVLLHLSPVEQGKRRYLKVGSSPVSGQVDKTGDILRENCSPLRQDTVLGSVRVLTNYTRVTETLQKSTAVVPPEEQAKRDALRERLDKLFEDFPLTEHFSVRITAEILAFMQQRERKPSEQSLFLNNNANAIAEAYGYDVMGREMQHGHVIGFFAGGRLANTLVAKNVPDKKASLVDGPQDLRNLIIMSKACNTEMMDLEKLVRELINTHGNEYVDLNVHFKRDPKAKMMASSIQFDIKAQKGYQPEAPLFVEPCSFKRPLFGAAAVLSADIARKHEAVDDISAPASKKSKRHLPNIVQLTSPTPRPK